MLYQIITKQGYMLMLALLALPEIVFAQSNEFQPLVGIPGIENNLSTEAYINAFFGLAIGAAAILATVKLIKAGVTYMFSDVVPEKRNAKGEIGGALLGLLIVLGSVTVLNEINPQLTRFNIFEHATTTSFSAPEDESEATPEQENGVVQHDGYVENPSTQSNILWRATITIQRGESRNIAIQPAVKACSEDGGAMYPSNATYSNGTITIACYR